MSPDVTITISTAGAGTDKARPVPALGGDASVTVAAGHASGPVPLPLDQLPTGSAGVSTIEAAGAGGLPVPTPLESLGTAAGSTSVGAAAPTPMDLGQMTGAPAGGSGGVAGPPTPQEVEAMAAAASAATSRGPIASERRTRRATSG